MELASVGGEDCDLVWFIVLQEKIAAESNHKHGLVLVLMAFSVFDLLFSAGVLHKKHVCIEAL